MWLRSMPRARRWSITYFFFPALLVGMFRPMLGENTEEVVDTTIRKIRGAPGGFGKERAHRQTAPGSRRIEHAVGAGRRMPYDNQFALSVEGRKGPDLSSRQCF
jgi:hypothetical protein